MFHSFLSGDSKQDTATTTAHSKCFIELSKKQKVLTSTLSAIWENTDHCVEQYRCASAIYLMSVFPQCHSIIIGQGISAPVHIKEVVDGLNAIDNHYIYQLISNVQLPVSKTLYSRILMHSCTQNNYINLAKQFQKHLSNDHRKHVVIDQGKYRKRSIKRKWTDIEYHVQDNSDIAHKDVKIYCDNNQFPALPFFGSHPKPCGARGLSKHYPLHFDSKLSHDVCAIFRISCDVLHVHKCWKNLGFMVFRQQNRHATNLSPNVLIGQFWAHITIGISLIYNQNKYILRSLIRYIGWLLTE